MKKSKAVFLLLLCLMIAFVFTGCKNKDTISSDFFKSTLESKGYQISDITEEYDDYGIQTGVLMAVDSEEINVEFQFHQMIGEEEAQTMFYDNKKIWDEKEGERSYCTELNVANYNKYSLQIDGEYVVFSQIADTLILVHTSSEYKDEVKEVLALLGY